MNKEDHDTTPPLVSVVSDDNSDDDSIGAPQVSERESLSNYGSPAIHIPPESPPQQSSEEAPERATPGRPIWERDKSIA